MAKKKKDEQEVFYVGIREPREVRKDLLESLKEVLEVMRSYESIKSIRTKKVELFVKLKEIMRQIDLSMNKLKRELPETRLRAKTTQPVSKSAPVERPKYGSEVERLERELDDIESKLSKLS